MCIINLTEVRNKKGIPSEVPIWDRIIDLAKRQNVPHAAILLNATLESIDHKNRIATLSFEDPEFPKVLRNKILATSKYFDQLFGVKFKIEIKN